MSSKKYNENYNSIFRNKKYFINFIEEFWDGNKSLGHFGRIEIFEGDNEVEELRFEIKNEQEYIAFREKWDFRDISENELKELKEENLKLYKRK